VTADLYRERILDHFHRPRHRGSLDAMQSVGRAAIPMCGDEIEVGIRERDNGRVEVRFRGRGCAVCIASASMMTEAVTGLTGAHASQLARSFIAWMLDRGDGGSLGDDGRDLVETFAAVRETGSRARCAALPWDALADALARTSPTQASASPDTTVSSVSVTSAPG
jgi:nitrogen fixation NifU-like protein